MRDFVAAGFFVQRTPALPWDEVQRWSAGIGAPHDVEAAGALEARMQADAGLLRQRLREAVRRPAISGAIGLASPGLYQRMGAWLDGATDTAARKIESAVLRYFMRMCSRPTPFGLFAGTSLGFIGARTHFSVPGQAAQRRRSRLDMGLLIKLAQRLSDDPAVQAQLRFTGPSITYQVDDRLRYCEARPDQDLIDYRLVDVTPSPPLAAALDALARGEGGATMADIAAHVGAVCAVDGSEAMAYVRELLAAGLLCSPLAPSATGAEPLERLIGQLNTVSAAAGTSDVLATVSAALRQLDLGGTGSGAAAASGGLAEQLAGKLRALAGMPASAPLLHVDLIKPAPGLVLGSALLADIERGCDLLLRIGTAPGDPLQAFKQAFRQRHQDRAMPLLEVLDAERGIGFEWHGGGADGGGHAGAMGMAGNASAAAPWGQRDKVLLRVLSEALLKGATSIELDDAVITALAGDDATDRGPLPPGMAAIVVIGATGPTGATGDTLALAPHAPAPAAARAPAQHLLHLKRLTGPSSCRLLGRFCASDPQLAEHVANTLRIEQSQAQTSLHAEICHLPHAGLGNVIFRPSLRQYEIPVGAHAGGAGVDQIPLSDLLVAVRDGQVYLRSASRARPVIPHLDCAHAFDRGGIGIYRFLACVATQNVAAERQFSWGALACAPFLPRVCHGKTILSLAQWQLDAHQLRSMASLALGARYEAIRTLRARLGLPRFVCYLDADRTLTVDLENILAIDSLLRLSKHAEVLTLSEVFPPPEQLVAAGPDGHFHQELIVPFVRRQAPHDASLPGAAPDCEAPPNAGLRPDASKPPGSDWLYLKLYGGPVGLERLLARQLPPLLARMRSTQAIARCFFVLYGDPDWHVRLRLQGPPGRLWHEVAPALIACVTAGTLALERIALDTYDPEIERYGGARGQTAAEAIFEADSDAALALLAGYGPDAPARWSVALLSMAMLLDDFGLTAGDRLHLLDQCAAACRARDHQARGPHAPWSTRRLARQCRALRAEVRTLLTAPPPRYARALDAFGRRSQAVVLPVRWYQSLAAAGSLNQPLHSIIASLLHMGANRLGVPWGSHPEVLLLELLRRAYTEQSIVSSSVATVATVATALRAPPPVVRR
jgi:thiopeptide-type bacteriocin biosynthesis protein